MALTPRVKATDMRLATIRLVFFIFIGLLIFRLYQLQVAERDFYTALASGQHDLLAELLPERGEILIQDALTNKPYPLATNLTLSLVYAVPKEVVDPEHTAASLAPVLSLDEEELIAKLSKRDDPYEPLRHALTDDLAQKVSELELVAIYLAPEAVRHYLGGENFGQITGFIGFAGEDRQGQYGLEQYWEETLAGVQGELRGEREAGGGVIALGKRQVTPAVDGADLVLTLDKNIQLRACAAIKQAVAKHGAVSGSVVIIEPQTGAIMAMCGWPNFDPNIYSEVADASVYVNQAVTVAYEPGSVFKPITMAAALQQGAVTPQTTYLDSGEVKIGSNIIKNSDLKAHGVQTMTQVLQESLNTGAIYALRQAGTEAFVEMVKKFGFGQVTGVELPSERAGNIKSLQEKNEIYAATASFGQGITVTPLQLTAAFGAIANGGRLLKPYLVKEIRYVDGRIQTTTPLTVKQVMAPETATTLSAMLVQVVEQGHGKRAGVPGYYVAGKTGTAQVPFADKAGYDPTKTIGTFAGFAPVDNPKFVMTVRIDEPKDVVFAESSAAPVFGELAKFLLEYHQVPPERAVGN